MKRMLERYDIGCTDLDRWVVCGRAYTVADTGGLANIAADVAWAALWRMQAKRRLHLQGQEQGRDEEAMEALMAEVKSPKDVAMFNIVISDSVYTSARAHIRWRFTGGCTLCGVAQGDWLHYVEGCPLTPRTTDAQDIPIAYDIQATYRQDGSRHQAAGKLRPTHFVVHRIQSPALGEVATVGSRIGAREVRGAGWRPFLGQSDARNTSEAGKGRVQTTARAEAYVVAVAFTITERNRNDHR